MLKFRSRKLEEKLEKTYGSVNKQAESFYLRLIGNVCEKSLQGIDEDGEPTQNPHGVSTVLVLMSSRRD